MGAVDNEKSGRCHCNEICQAGDYKVRAERTTKWVIQQMSKLTPADLLDTGRWLDSQKWLDGISFNCPVT